MLAMIVCKGSFSLPADGPGTMFTFVAHLQQQHQQSSCCTNRQHVWNCAICIFLSLCWEPGQIWQTGSRSWTGTAKGRDQMHGKGKGKDRLLKLPGPSKSCASSKEMLSQPDSWKAWGSASKWPRSPSARSPQGHAGGSCCFPSLSLSLGFINTSCLHPHRKLPSSFPLECHQIFIPQCCTVTWSAAGESQSTVTLVAEMCECSQQMEAASNGEFPDDPYHRQQQLTGLSGHWFPITGVRGPEEGWRCEWAGCACKCRCPRGPDWLQRCVIKIPWNPSPKPVITWMVSRRLVVTDNGFIQAFSVGADLRNKEGRSSPIFCSSPKWRTFSVFLSEGVWREGGSKIQERTQWLKMHSPVLILRGEGKGGHCSVLSFAYRKRLWKTRSISR